MIAPSVTSPSSTTATASTSTTPEELPAMEIVNADVNSELSDMHQGNYFNRHRDNWYHCRHTMVNVNSNAILEQQSSNRSGHNHSLSPEASRR